MDRDSTQRQIPHAAAADMEPTDDFIADVDEPPETKTLASWTSQLHATFGKANPQIFDRRESLLTRQLHSEAEHTDEDDLVHPPARALSTQSTSSNRSVASTAELTSDDGHSVVSPAISPPLPPTAMRTTIPITDKLLTNEPRILGQEDKVIVTTSEQSVEAGLGRKRCISFACGKKEAKLPPSQPAQILETKSAASPPKRKNCLTFVCPTRTGASGRSSERSVVVPKRHVSPPAPMKRSSAKTDSSKTHRGSDSTVTHASPTSVRKVSSVVAVSSTPTASAATPLPRRKMSNGSDDGTEATRFHEFASSDDEPEDWVQESTCHRSRLTVNDTLQKENIIRKACEEVEEEVIEEEEAEAEEEDLEDELNGEDEELDDDEDIDDDEESDEGFRTDDEEGFAESDSEGEGSDEEWWRPGGLSTAATSVDHLERLAFARTEEIPLSSSIGSASSDDMSSRRVRSSHKRRTNALPIRARSSAHELPDSTDFVCGTLDEDRPLEQAFLNNLKQKAAAKHVARPQDIDPTFPTSDPEMDEEDDEDLDDPEESHDDNLMHGNLDELDGDLTARRRSSLRPPTRSNVDRSPASTARYRSPAPAVVSRQGLARSPAPTKRIAARSPAPRRLFGRSPMRSRSPAPAKRLPSPPNTRRASPSRSDAFDTAAHVLASRPQLTYTASLPRGGFMLGKFNNMRMDDGEESDTVGTNATGEVPKRGAIDIFKGLEKKRQRRKEKLYQKACAKAAAKGEKAYKVKPGKGAERMREVGLEMQRYHGKGGHIISM